MAASPAPPDAVAPDDRPVRVVRARGGAMVRIGEIVRYRELLANLVRKELKVKYKESTLGFVWTLLNPALRLAVFYVVFETILLSGINRFVVFLLSGLLLWDLFSSSLAAATGTVVGNGMLIKKVAFPREILPLAAIGAGLVHFLLQSLVLVGALLVLRHGVDPSAAVLIPAGMITLLLFLTALSVLLSALNVYLRDVQHLLDLALMAWFWMTPIIYPFRMAADRLGSNSWVYLLNPMTSIVLAFQRSIYNRTESVRDGVVTPILPDAGTWWYLRNLGFVAAASVVLLIVGMAVFRRLEGNFAEEL